MLRARAKSMYSKNERQVDTFPVKVCNRSGSKLAPDARENNTVTHL